MNFCRDMTVGKGAGERRKLLSMDSSVGAMVCLCKKEVCDCDVERGQSMVGDACSRRLTNCKGVSWWRFRKQLVSLRYLAIEYWMMLFTLVNWSC